MGRQRSRKRRGRPVTGILLLDKPTDLSSNKALQQAKYLYFANKAGHTGSLDPLATGLLPLCFGEATKFSQFLLDADKAYQTTIVLGASSTTEDADGELEFIASAENITQSEVLAATKDMLGEQLQVPPMYSALKQNGRRLYDLAREGIEVEREARPVTVKRFEVISLSPFVSEKLPGKPLVAVEIEAEVSKGTYIRSLAAELGSRLGTGGYVEQLRRTAVGGFSVSGAVTLEQLEELKEAEQFSEMDALLTPTAEALLHLPEVSLDENSSFYLRRGNPVQVPKAPTEGIVCLLQDNGEFLGVGEINDQGLVAPKRLVVNE